MSVDEILAIEEEVKQLHHNPVQASHSFSRLDAKTTFTGFWNIHVKPVIEISKALAKKYNSPVSDSVWLAAIFHDIARLSDEEPHDEIGAERAKAFLNERGLDGQYVKQIILTHRCKKHRPETLEQKILATADAMAHFQQPFYLWYSHISNKSLSEQFKTMAAKMEWDYYVKIFWDSERDVVRSYYEALKRWVNGGEL